MRFVGVLFLLFLRFGSGLMVVFGIAQQIIESILNHLSSQVGISLHLVSVYSERIHVL